MRMSRLSKDFLICTFAIMSVCWGICLICSYNNILLNNNYVLYIPYLFGGLSPTIASYIALKKNRKISTFKDWAKNVFDWKHNAVSYLLVIGFGVLFILPQCLIAGYEKGAPFFAIIVMIPMMLIGGGLEEAGWRYILQPELETRHTYLVSTIIVSLIWWLWHFPLFYIQGVSQYGQNYLAFGINVIGLSFALACIRKCTKGVWLYVLFHCICNSLSGIYIVHENILSSIITAALLIAVSFVILNLDAKKKIFLKH